MDGFLSLTPAYELTTRWRRLREDDPFVSIPDAANRLEVVEAELVASLCGTGVLRLDRAFGDFVRALPGLGRVRAITRNAHAAIETRGTYPDPAAGCAGAAGAIGARFFLEQWRHGYAVDDETTGERASGVFFYDGRGKAVHELHVEPDTDRRKLAQLLDLFACFDQSPGDEFVFASPHLLVPRCDLAAWLRHAEEARPIGVAAVSEVLQMARCEALPVSIAVHSPGVVQRFSGLLHDVAHVDGRVLLEAAWIRAWVALRGVVEAWVVCSPSLDGPVMSIELIDADSRVVFSVSGARWPGMPEPSLWREILARIPTAASHGGVS
jgi:putative hemin transport protein